MQRMVQSIDLGLPRDGQAWEGHTLCALSTEQCWVSQIFMVEAETWYEHVCQGPRWVLTPSLPNSRAMAIHKGLLLLPPSFGGSSLGSFLHLKIKSKASTSGQNATRTRYSLSAAEETDEQSY